MLASTTIETLRVHGRRRAQSHLIAGLNFRFGSTRTLEPILLRNVKCHVCRRRSRLRLAVPAFAHVQTQCQSMRSLLAHPKNQYSASGSRKGQSRTQIVDFAFCGRLVKRNQDLAATIQDASLMESWQPLPELISILCWLATDNGAGYIIDAPNEWIDVDLAEFRKPRGF